MTSPRSSFLRRATVTVAAAALPMTMLAPAAAAQGEVTLTYTLLTTGDCSGLTLAGEAGEPDTEFVATKLTDPDGDGDFTGTAELAAGPQVVRFEAFFADLEEDQLTNPEIAELGVDARVITNLGTLTLDGDRTVEASYDCAARLPDTGGDAGARDLAPAAGAGALAALSAAGYLLLRRRRPAA